MVILAVPVCAADRPPGPLTAAERRALRPGGSFQECNACPEMVAVPAGSFMMGSPATEVGHFSEEDPQLKVTIARPFAVGKYEVTFAEWDACVGASGCKHQPGDEGWGRGKRPVVNVSWNDITTEYLPWLRGKTGKTYRLLTEAEWEYAARAGSTTRFHFGDDEKELCTYGNVLDQTAARLINPLAAETAAKILGPFPDPASCRDGYVNTAPVGSFKPNAFGLYDMHGNVSEWVLDCFWHGYFAQPVDGSARTSVWSVGEFAKYNLGPAADCGLRRLRGGSWSSFPRFVRSANREGFFIPLNLGASDRGFRVARTLDEK